MDTWAAALTTQWNASNFPHCPPFPLHTDHALKVFTLRKCPASKKCPHHHLRIYSICTGRCWQWLTCPPWPRHSCPGRESESCENGKLVVVVCVVACNKMWCGCAAVRVRVVVVAGSETGRECGRLWSISPGTQSPPVVRGTSIHQQTAPAHSTALNKWLLHKTFSAADCALCTNCILHTAHCTPHYLRKVRAQNARIFVCHHTKCLNIHWTANSKCQRYPHTHPLDLKHLQTTMSELDWRESTYGRLMFPQRWDNCEASYSCVTPSPPLLVL